MTKAFDNALFVPGNELPDIGQAVGVDALGPPFDTSYYYYVIAPGPGVTMGASIPAATDAGQTIRSGPAPGFPWEAVPPYYLGALAAPPSTNPAPGAPPLPLAGTMYYNTTDSTPYILAKNQTDWIPLPVATAARLTIAASLPAATQQGQTLVSGPSNGGVVFPWAAQQSMFLGAHPTPPTTANGSLIPVGSFYYNTSNSQVYVWNGSGWQSITVPAKAVTASLYYAGTAGQTVFNLTTNDIFGKNHTLSTTGQEGIEVYVNGVRAVPNGGTVTGDYSVDYPSSTIAMTVGVSGPSLVTFDILEDPLRLAPVQVLVSKLKPLTFDGTTTTFLLQNSGGITIVAADPVNLMVSIDGVLQEAGVDYILDVTGTQIIYATAPAADAKGFIVWFGKA